MNDLQYIEYLEENSAAELLEQVIAELEQLTWEELIDAI